MSRLDRFTNVPNMEMLCRVPRGARYHAPCHECIWGGVGRCLPDQARAPSLTILKPLIAEQLTCPD
ncbi:hypothetical protein VPHD292_0099 [Vibrio phage D292]